MRLSRAFLPTLLLLICFSTIPIVTMVSPQQGGPLPFAFTRGMAIAVCMVWLMHALWPALATKGPPAVATNVAAPVPMALESGTVYEAQDAGEILGYFTVKGAARVNAPASAGDRDSETTDNRPWMGVGDWKTASPKLDTYSNRPQHAEVVRRGIDSISGPIVDENAPSADGEKPLLHSRAINGQAIAGAGIAASAGLSSIKDSALSWADWQELVVQITPYFAAAQWVLVTFVVFGAGMTLYARWHDRNAGRA